MARRAGSIPVYRFLLARGVEVTHGTLTPASQVQALASQPIHKSDNASSYERYET